MEKAAVVIVGMFISAGLLYGFCWLKNRAQFGQCFSEKFFRLMRNEKGRDLVESALMVAFVVIAYIAIVVPATKEFKERVETSRINAEFKICIGDSGGNPEFRRVCEGERDRKLTKLKEAMSK